MSPITKNTALTGMLAFATKAVAHGIVTAIIADGQSNRGYDPAFQYQNPPPTVAGWSIPQVQNRGYVSDLNGPDIICHRGATPGGTYVKVAAGGTLQFKWTEWPESHHGPVMDYLAPCGDDCTSIEKTSLRFIKVAEAGLIDGTTPPGRWASDDMIAAGSTWTVQVPSDVAPGKYVWRHETIALHASHENQGAQPYPQCVNLEITGSGTDDFSGGIPATEFYSWQDPGIALNIYHTLPGYVIPGPALRAGGVGGSGSGSGSASTSSSGFTPQPTPAATITTTTTTTDSPATSPSGTINAQTGGIFIPVSPVAAVTSTSTVTTTVTTILEQSQPTSVSPATTATATTTAESTSSTFSGRITKPTKVACRAKH